MNFLSARIDRVDAAGARMALDAAPDNASPPLRVIQDGIAPGTRVSLGIRPEHVSLQPVDGPAIEATATIERLEQLGAVSFLYCRLPGGAPLTVQVPGQLPHRSGDTLGVRLPVASVHMFDTSEHERALMLHDRVTR
jgi:ABC-type sugar transport system ATPase subunit